VLTRKQLLHNVAENLKALRDHFGLLQHELATGLGVTPSLMSRWESEERDPGLYGAYKIAEYYGLVIDEIIYPITNIRDVVLPKKEEPLDQVAIDATKTFDDERALQHNPDRLSNNTGSS